VHPLAVMAELAAHQVL
jgi:hypothetical protein